MRAQGIDMPKFIACAFLIAAALLGTGAADGIPGFYAKDRVSQYARTEGGKDVRTRSAALVDGALKIDLPPDTLVHLHQNRLDARDWSALLFTHSHEDHYGAVLDLWPGFDLPVFATPFTAAMLAVMTLVEVFDGGVIVPVWAWPLPP